jgi:4-amino-4-deoxy-L-arabinose transferase-like glycosyltransferase
VRELVPAVPAEALVPLGYNLAADRESMVPIYAAGLPLVMALFERLGGPAAVFWVVPLLGGVAVGSTWLLARLVAGRLAGALAAVALAASPAFLLQLTAAPMSEVPATAWWTLALALLFSRRAGAAPGAGLAAGLAILTRPNLVALALVAAVLLLWRARGSPLRRRRLLLFCGPVVVACLAVAAINDRQYGSPLESGYDVRGLYGFEHALPNLVHYPVLRSAMQTPAIWLAACKDRVFTAQGGSDGTHRGQVRW